MLFKINNYKKCAFNFDSRHSWCAWSWKSLEVVPLYQFRERQLHRQYTVFSPHDPDQTIAIIRTVGLGWWLPAPGGYDAAAPPLGHQQGPNTLAGQNSHLYFSDWLLHSVVCNTWTFHYILVACSKNPKIQKSKKYVFCFKDWYVLVQYCTELYSTFRRLHCFKFP